MTRKLAESTDSEGICADMMTPPHYRNPSTSSGRGSSMTSSSINNQFDRMFLSTVSSTPRRPPTRIPALMTKSLHSTRSHSTPNQLEPYGSGEQLCQDFDGFKSGFRRLETEMLLSRSQEKRQFRASSYDPRCLISLHPSGPYRLSTSASASTNSNHLKSMTSSSLSTSILNPISSYSRLLPKRPKWSRNQPASEIKLAESLISLDGGSGQKMKTSKFYLDSDDDSEDEILIDYSESENEDENENLLVETPRSRRKQASIRKLKEKNRKKFRSTIRRLQPAPPLPSSNSSESSKNLQNPFNFSDFLCVSSPFFYLIIAFLFRFLLFFTEIFLPF